MTTQPFNRTRALELLALPPKDKLIGANLVAILEQLRLAVERIAELEGRIGGMCEYIKDNV